MGEVSAPPIRVMVVDDHPLIRDGLRRAIGASGDMRLVAEAENGAEALEAVERLDGSVDVVVMDSAMPVMDGLEAAERLVRGFPDVRIVIMSGFDEPETVRRAFQMGVCGYLLKSLTGEQLLNGIRVVVNGGTIVDPTLITDAGVLIEASADAPREMTLSRRRRQVLSMIAKGYTNERIARELQVAPSTVKRHVSDVLTRLGVHDRASAVAMGFRLGLIE